MGGLGKTTLVRKVYHDADVKKHFQFRVWITLSPSFKEEDLLKDIIQQLFRVLQKNVPQGMDNDRLKTAINRFLQKKRYLIVLDDVWHTDAWDAFEPVFPNNSRGSHILLTTRKTEVALTACIEFPDKVYNLGPLSPEESLDFVLQEGISKQRLPSTFEERFRKNSGKM